MTARRTYSRAHDRDADARLTEEESPGAVACASERMAELVEAALRVAVDVGQAPARTKAALLEAIGKLERDRDAMADRLAAFDSCNRARRAAEAEVARLAGVAREACDALAEASEWNADNVASSIKVTLGGERQYLADCGDDIANLRAAIPTPDPAAFVAAVERFAAARSYRDRLDHDADEWRVAEHNREHDAARAALLALGGVR